jgi:hypothetical protein
MKARNAKKLVTTSEQLEELTPAELAEVGGGFGYGGMPCYGGFRYGGFRYGGFRYGGRVPFYRRPRFQQVYFPYI